MEKRIKWLLFAILLMAGSTYALDYQWTSFSKLNKPITLPATQFCSWATASGSIVTGWDCYMKIWESGFIYTYAELFNASGDVYKTASNFYTTWEIDVQLAAFVWGLIYRGTWSMSGWNYPANMNTWDFYKINEAGTWDWVYYWVWDMMVGNTKESWWTEAADRDRIVNVVAPEIDPIRESEKANYYTTGYITNLLLSYVPWTSVATGIVWTGSDIIIPSTKAVVDYIDIYSQSLWSVLTTGAYILSGSARRQITLSWNNLSFQYYSGWMWVEKGQFTP